ncbi:GTP cyclohydrolase II RibA [Marinobacter shengliensis]|uniref:GTP cyclohydrolase II RibA n=1 Tax=Marinobacter shengliensis TaxID=1389223 RepID=UPI002573D818|nr:GTP cyclohydrolase II RibA [Marinobacter shengliensis]BEH15618.1 hypothetical protein MAALD49_29860 [Marinobacter shengliensis]
MGKETKIQLDTKHGKLITYTHTLNNETCVVIKSETLPRSPFLRIHSSCLFSESFHATDCDCASQLDAALEYIKKNGGIIIYLYQEGRGIGISEKVKSIYLEQTKALNTAEAFSELGHQQDPRNYAIAIDVLKTENIQIVTIATNNPNKVKALRDSGIIVESRINLDIEKNETMAKYLETKTEALGHYEKD